MKFVWFGGGGDWVGEFGWVDGDGAGEAGSGYVGDAKKRAFEAGDFDFFDNGVFDVCEEDSLSAGACYVFEGEPLRGVFPGWIAGAVDEDRDVGDVDVGEAEVFEWWGYLRRRGRRSSPIQATVEGC